MSSSDLSNTTADVLAQETQFNWPAMYTAFASGAPLDEIGATFACPMPLLRRVATSQDWAGMAARLTSPTPLPASTPDSSRLELIERNRRKNFEMADMLRDRLMHDFRQLGNGTLKVEKALVFKGAVIHTDVEPGPQDMVALANAAKAVSEMTYRSLGDVVGEDRQAARGNGDVAAITVILPTVVHSAPGGAPAEKLVQEATVVDLRPAPRSIEEERAARAAKKAAGKTVVAGLDGPPEDVV